MSEWWTYRPADFLMFAPRSYWRMFEMHNDAWWPAQPLFVLGGLGWMAWLLCRPGAAGGAALRLGALGLAAAAAGVAWGFLLPRFAPIHWAAKGYAAGFFVQALAMTALATRAGLRLSPARARRGAGLLLFAWSFVGHPLLAPASGRPWTQAEVFGLAPDPTAFATLGFLLCAAASGRAGSWLLRASWMLALVWCAISAATLWTMGSMQGWVPAAAAIAAVVPAAAHAFFLLASGNRFRRKSAPPA